MSVVVKEWQKGYEIEYLKQVSNLFSGFNEFSCSPFSEMSKNTVAESLANGHIEFLESAVVESYIVNSSRKITVDGNIAIGIKEEGDRVIKRISGDVLQLIEKIKSYEEPTWLFIWEEDVKSKHIAYIANYKKVGIKVTSFGEIYGVYFKDSSVAEKLFGERTHPEVPEYEKYALRKLKLKRKIDMNHALTYIEERLNSLPEFTDHYSNYNAKGSWSGLSLRGYRKDPSFIAKPVEMNKKWKIENTGCLEWKLVDTPLRSEFPEVETLLDMLPGEKHRIRFMKLKPEGELERHTDLVDPDQGISDGKLARIHFPIVTNKKVKFQNWDWNANAPEIHMKVSEAWYLDVRKPHRAINSGDEYRIHLVVDVESSEKLRSLI